MRRMMGVWTARTAPRRRLKYLWAVVPWLIVAGYAFLAVRLIVTAP